MNIKRVILSIICVTLMAICSSCGLGNKYVCDVDSVESIQIVKLDKYIEDELRFEYTVLAEITDCKEFINKLCSIRQTENWSAPRMIDVDDVVIRINYTNGDYDLVKCDAQYCYRSGVGASGPDFFFDEEQFNSLISDYLEEE